MNSNLHQAQSHDILRSWQSQRNDINHHKDFVLPMFIGNDDDAIEPIDSMPEVFRYGCDRAIEYLEPLVSRYGLRSVLLFPVITKSDQAKLGSNETSDDEDDEGAELSSSSSTNRSRSSLTSGDSSLSEGNQESSVRPERLVNDDQGASSGSTNNPFLNQNEETENLLGNEQPNEPPTSSEKQQQKQQSNQSVLRSPLANEQYLRISKTQDIKLIKGLALKDKHNPVLRLISSLRVRFPELLIICDVCLCAFTSTGHCCLFEDHARAKSAGNGLGSGLMAHFPISNKLTCQYLAMLAVEYAKRGCNVVAPSDMMDGRIMTIREKLNECGLHHVSILSYSAKFASAFYGPFRQATDNAPEFGDRRAYQLPPGSRALALKAVQRDIDQGADFIMVKPGGAYLDIVRDIANQHPEVPVAVYQVSGEYSMIRMAAQNGLVNLHSALNETLTAFRRAGATIIITYFTPEILKGEMRFC